MRDDNLRDQNTTERDELSNGKAPCTDDANAKQGHTKIEKVTHNVTNDNIIKPNA